MDTSPGWGTAQIPDCATRWLLGSDHNHATRCSARASMRNGSAFCSRYRATSPGGRGELGRTTIPPRLRQDTQRQVPGCVFEAGADVDGPNEVVDEPHVGGL